MNSIDPKLQSAVWNRVMSGCSGTVSQEAAAPAQGALSARELLDMMQGEKNDCAVYRYFSRKACGRDARTFQAMADVKACHFQKLHTMYFLVAGECASLQAARPNCTTCMAEELRIRYNEELKAAAWYEAAAKRWPAMADEFRCMAAETMQMTREIRSMICRLL